MSNIPADLSYAKSHEWLRVAADGTAVIGITDYAQSSLGDITFVQLPKAGTTLAAGATFGVVESVKAASDLYAPAACVVIEANAALDAAPEADLIVTLGSPAGAWEDIPWVHAQRRFLQDRMAAGTPVVGICFGAQILATAIGGRAAPMGDRTFCGWHANEHVADDVWRGPWVRWHADHLEVPEATEVLARDQGTAFVLVTHDQSLAARCGRHLQLTLGKLSEAG
jgi:glycine cleavage system H protein